MMLSSTGSMSCYVRFCRVWVLDKRYCTTWNRLIRVHAGMITSNYSLLAQETNIQQRSNYFLQRLFINPKRPLFMKAMIKIPGSGENLPGQGLKKITEKENKELEEKSIVLRFINRRIEAQKKGEKTLPFLPDYAFFLGTFIFVSGCILIGGLFYPDVKELLVGLKEFPTENSAISPDRITVPLVKLYTMVPLRIVSRAWGRIMDLEIKQVFRKPALQAFCWLTGADIMEALVKDYRCYNSIATFFRRPIDPTYRPISEESHVVSPVDGTVLTFGKVNEGLIEQVKGVTYSLQKFLGPLVQPPLHKNWGGNPEHIKNWSVAPLKQYQPALMHDPVNNNLYQCVIYLAPGDYHRFHSPVTWIMKHRRHFPGQLLSVNPKIASWVRDLFVLNERVVLSGTWEHGYFSITAVGATNVGSIHVYEDLLLKTNSVKWKYGTYYDATFSDEGFEIKKGEQLGEFNMGSTVVVVFEAPKSLSLCVDEGQKLKYGEGIVK